MLTSRRFFIWQTLAGSVLASCRRLSALSLAPQLAITASPAAQSQLAAARLLAQALPPVLSFPAEFTSSRESSSAASHLHIELEQLDISRNTQGRTLAARALLQLTLPSGETRYLQTAITRQADTHRDLHLAACDALVRSMQPWITGHMQSHLGGIAHAGSR